MDSSTQEPKPVGEVDEEEKSIQLAQPAAEKSLPVNIEEVDEDNEQETVNITLSPIIPNFLSFVRRGLNENIDDTRDSDEDTENRTMSRNRPQKAQQHRRSLREVSGNIQHHENINIFMEVKAHKKAKRISEP